MLFLSILIILISAISIYERRNRFIFKIPMLLVGIILLIISILVMRKKQKENFNLYCYYDKTMKKHCDYKFKSDIY